MFGAASPLTLAALAAWVATAAFGGNLLLRGKAYRLLLSAAARTSSQPRRPILRATLMALHWLGAVSGLILWTGYVLSDRRPLAQSALVLLGVVALLGITVVDRWHGSGRHAVQQGDGRGFPVWVGNGPCDGSHGHPRTCGAHHLGARRHVTPDPASPQMATSAASSDLLRQIAGTGSLPAAPAA